MKDITIVVGAYDQYSKAWKPFIHGFNKYWKDCPWDNKVFITNELEAPEGFGTIKSGKTKAWGESARKGVEQVKTPYMLWMLEDFWITGKVDTEALLRFYAMMKRDDLYHIRILPPANGLEYGAEIIPDLELKCSYPKDDNPEINKLWLFKDDATYRASLSVSLWRTDFFLKIVRDGFTPWDFEVRGNVLSRGNDKCLCTLRPDILPWGWRTNPYPNGKFTPIMKGKWSLGALDYVKYEELDGRFLQIHPNGQKNTGDWAR